MPDPGAGPTARRPVLVLNSSVDAFWPPALVEATGYARPPFAGGVVSGGPLLHTSGQTYPDLTDIHPRLPTETGMYEQATACLRNIDHVLNAAGSSVIDVVKVTIYNTDMAQQGEINRAYREYFGQHRPARTHVGVTALAGEGLLVEIEVVAHAKDSDGEQG